MLMAVAVATFILGSTFTKTDGTKEEFSYFGD